MKLGTADNRSTAASRVQSVGKALEILHAFDGRNRALSLRQLAERTGVPRSTCHALVNTLIDGGFLERSGPHGRYRLGPALVVLSGRLLEGTRYQDAVYEVITSQLSNLRVEVHTAQFVGTGIVYLQKNGQSQRLENTTGRFFELTSSACGLAVLMALPREEILRHLPESSPSHQAKTLHRLSVQLRRGYILSSASQPGFLALASPIRDVDGTVLGAIGTADHRGAMSARRVEQLGTAFRNAALDASRALGYSGPKEGLYAPEALTFEERDTEI